MNHGSDAPRLPAVLGLCLFAAFVTIAVLEGSLRERDDDVALRRVELERTIASLRETKEPVDRYQAALRREEQKRDALDRLLKSKPCVGELLAVALETATTPGIRLEGVDCGAERLALAGSVEAISHVEDIARRLEEKGFRDVREGASRDPASLVFGIFARAPENFCPPREGIQ
jgi:hypothetical protein